MSRFTPKRKWKNGSSDPSNFQWEKKESLLGSPSLTGKPGAHKKSLRLNIRNKPQAKNLSPFVIS